MKLFEIAQNVVFEDDTLRVIYEEGQNELAFLDKTERFIGHTGLFYQLTNGSFLIQGSWDRDQDLDDVCDEHPGLYEKIRPILLKHRAINAVSDEDIEVVIQDVLKIPFKQFRDWITEKLWQADEVSSRFIRELIIRRASNKPLNNNELRMFVLNTYYMHVPKGFATVGAKVLRDTFMDPNLQMNLSKKNVEWILRQPDDSRIIPDDIYGQPDYPDIRQAIVNTPTDPKVQQYLDQQMYEMGMDE